MKIYKKLYVWACAAVITAASLCAWGSEQEKAENIVPENAQEVWNGITVGIDPGHQGSWIDMSETEPIGPGSSQTKEKCTTGTTGTTTHIPEYKLNLDISLKVEQELKKRGYHVVMTRDDHDVAISNSERAITVSEQGADIYVRIHANGSDDSSVAGALAMIMSPDNAYVSNLYENSQILAKDILDSYCKETGFHNLGIQLHDDMSGINWSKVPVMILEMGYMTNHDEDIAMQLERNQSKMADGIADGIEQYFTDIGKLVNGEQDPDSEEAEHKTDMDNAHASESDQTADKDKDLKNNAMKTLYENYIRGEEEKGAKWAVGIEDLKSGKVISYNENAPMQSASVIKVFIMGAVYDRICYPSGDSQKINYSESYQGELRSLLENMITVSSNDAANRLVEILGENNFQAGAKVVNDFCQKKGYTHTSVGRRFMETNPTGDNFTSAGDCRKILADIYRGKCVNPEADAKMLGILKKQTVRYKIPAGLPSGYSSANKTGEMPNDYKLGCIENDIAIVFSPLGDYVLTVLSNNLNGRNNEADDNITRISTYVAAHQKELLS